VTLERPIRVVLHIADCALRADIADACEGAGIAVAASRAYPPPSLTLPRLRGWDVWEQGAADGDVVLTDRPIETAVSAIALVSGEPPRVWPANVRAVVPADVDAATLVAIITVVAAGYALAPPAYPPPPPSPSLPRQRGREGWGTGEDKGGGADEDPSPFADPSDAADEPANALSLREREVLALLAEGASNKEIARALALSIHTIKFHVAALTEKLCARSRGEAVAIAIRAGLVMV
jgi:DNA-binding NarL/FixJ family response regulator